ncbi:MAG TPA: RtcB family protein [Spirochaetes bacterium]|nr:RtcB family protein [Spirochaetota bacterium]
MNIRDMEKIGEYLYELPREYKKGMRVPARIYGDERLVRDMDDAVLEQITNVATLPGIQRYALCMPDGHSGYGFPIGGVAAIDPDTGVISPGGIGFDINCGIRLMATSLRVEEARPHLKKLVDTLYARVPSGVGAEGPLDLKGSRFDDAMVKGARWAVENGFGTEEDLTYIEENGRVSGADPDAVSDRARERGRNQVGTLGSGNHFLEIQAITDENIYDVAAAEEFGVSPGGRVVVMIHSGSRAFGHQVATDYLKRFNEVMWKVYGLSMPDRELACAPFASEDGKAYFGAMNCAINIAFLNRQVMTHMVREVFSEVFRKSPEELGMRLVYDVCHNTAKLESFTAGGGRKKLLVHRKGATRSFPPGAAGVPSRYASAGQPVIIGGSMETGSYLCAGMAGAEESFYSTVHGSGRTLSRSQAKKRFRGQEVRRQMEERGIYVRSSSYAGLAEEAGGAYKDIDAVVEAAFRAGLCRPVAKCLPLGNIKG